MNPTMMGALMDLILPSAQTVEKLSYGDPLFRMPPSGTGSYIPQTTDKGYVAEVAGMLPLGAPAAKPSAKALEALVRDIRTTPPVGAVNIGKTAGLLDQAPKQSQEVLYRMEEPQYQNPDQGAIFYAFDKTYSDLYGSPGRVLRTAKMPENVVDIRKKSDKKMAEDWTRNKLESLQDEVGSATEIRDGMKMLKNGDISGAMANISLLVGKQQNMGIVPGIAEKMFLSDLGKDAMTVKEAGRAATDFSVAFRDSETARKYLLNLD
jgi:hypothetical protein